MKNEVLRIGVMGAGHLGRIHLGILQQARYFSLAGFYDPDVSVMKKAQEELGIKPFASEDDLIESVDVVDIVTPTITHFQCAVKALKKSRHLFIEKPVAATVEEAKELISLAGEAGVKVQVGHVERFNPAFTAARPYIVQPMFIEAHRLAQFNPRGTDVPVVLDLMIHDIDIVLSVVNSGVKRISASGVAVLSDTPDIANARIEFSNGCVANLTASRISLKRMRKTRFFQKDAYISVDFLEKTAEVIRLSGLEGEPGPLDVTIDMGEKGRKLISFEKPAVMPVNAIEEELKYFAASVRENTLPPVTLEDGYEALTVAYQVMEKISAGLKKN